MKRSPSPDGGPSSQAPPPPPLEDLHLVSSESTLMASNVVGEAAEVELLEAAAEDAELLSDHELVSLIGF